MATFYRGLRTARPPRIQIVKWEVLDDAFPILWCVTLACGHTREVKQGYRADAGTTYGVVLINGERFICTPRKLNCAQCVPLQETP